MDKKDVLGVTAKTLAGIEVGGKQRDAELAALDRGILEVALMVAGLDGTILPSEYEAFATMAKKCRGATAANTKSVFESATAKAGWVVSMARSGLFSEATRLSNFVRLAHDSLPKGFACGSLADMRRAFALWIAMGVSDGGFSSFERKCVQTLARRFALARAGKSKRFEVLLESSFFARAEKIFRDMAVASRREKAERELAELVATVTIKTKTSPAHYESAAIKLAAPLPGPTIAGWR